MVPEVAPSGFSVSGYKTPTEVPRGAGPWMCAAVVFADNPEKVTFTFNVLLAVFNDTVPTPEPVRPPPPSCAPSRKAWNGSNVCGLAWLSESVHGPVIAGASCSVPLPVHDTVTELPLRDMARVGPPPPPNGP